MLSMTRLCYRRSTSLYLPDILADTAVPIRLKRWPKMTETQHVLSGVPLFSGLSVEELDAIKTHAIPKSYRKHTIIIEKGDETTSLYVIISGRVKIFVADSKGKEVIVNTQGPGEHLGELSLLGESQRTASVMTLEDTRVLVISRQAFLACLTKQPTIALNVIKALVQRVRELTDNVSDLALLDVYGRVANTLLKHAVEEEGVMVTEKLTHQEIANMVGSSREMVSRIFKDLKIGGYVTVEDKRVIIHKKLPAHW